MTLIDTITFARTWGGKWITIDQDGTIKIFARTPWRDYCGKQWKPMNIPGGNYITLDCKYTSPISCEWIYAKIDVDSILV